ncbi:methyltransferase domain-containing protein [Lentisalinibacter salinarum]|uniref:methyltransferase domain-containing protein n=1 Tax=Lentisalinibacter salinarum TaxID=2992239 RepID=UPI00386DAE6D
MNETLALCRFCSAPLEHTFVDLGVTPLCQTHITSDSLNSMEPFYPLHAMVCDSCLLVQLQEYVAPSDIFAEYAYFSSFSDSWLEHARSYSRSVIERFRLDEESFVVEIASNDGYLLRNFVEAEIPCLGIEPAANVAEAAKDVGVESISCFFGRDLAAEIVRERGKADLIVGNNVLAHVPALNDFVAGMKYMLADDGVITMEFPHLLRLIQDAQFDTIYHEHFSYFSLLAASRVFREHGLDIFDVDELTTHGGSLRVYARHRGGDSTRAVGRAVIEVQAEEKAAGLGSMEGYTGFQERVNRIKRDLLAFLIDVKRQGKRIAAYGAPGKGNTLLNYCGIGKDLIEYTVDRNPYKQGKFTPGMRLPILEPSAIRETQPDYVLILPWNLKTEIISGNAYIADWGGQFVVPIPNLELIDPAACRQAR